MMKNVNIILFILRKLNVILFTVYGGLNVNFLLLLVNRVGRTDQGINNIPKLSLEGAGIIMPPYT